MSLMEVKRKLNELKMDLQTAVDQRFTDESDERVITGFIDKSLKCIEDLRSETDLLAERLNFLEKEIRSKGQGFKVKGRAIKKKKKAVKAKKKAKGKKKKKAAKSKKKAKKKKG